MPAGRFSKNIYPGARFGRLTVLERIPRDATHRSRVRCLCDCGAIIEPSSDNLRHYKSCGCWRAEALKGYRDAHKICEVGQAYGLLTVIEFHAGYEYNAICRCECGKTVALRSDGLLNGTRSCGCLNKAVRRSLVIERNKKSAKFGGITRVPGSDDKLIHQTWASMRLRLTRSKDYENVRACKFIWDSPLNLKKIIGYRPAREYTIDRFPVWNGNYTCGQCEECKANGWLLNIRWATRRQQSLNRGTFNVPISAFGKTMLLCEWADESNLDGCLIRDRMKRGWSAERALMTPNSKGVGGIAHP